MANRCVLCLKVVAINCYFWQSKLVSGNWLLAKRKKRHQFKSNQQPLTSNIKQNTLNYLKQTASLTNRNKKKPARLTRNSKIIKTIIAAIQEKKGDHIVSLDLRKIKEAVADFFIVCEAASQPQIRAIADNIKDRVREKCSENPFHHEGYAKLQWVLIDYVNVVVHVMLPENRKFYRLEEMWSDGVAGDHND